MSIEIKKITRKVVQKESSLIIGIANKPAGKQTKKWKSLNETMLLPIRRQS